MSPLPRLALALLTFASATAAQAQWTRAFPAIHPPSRSHAPGVSDGTGLLVFGGKASPVFEHNDLWRYDGVAWNDITPVGALPARREMHASAYDPARGRLVVFGGRTGTAALGDTWEFDGTGWVQGTPATTPTPRCGASMIFDPSLGTCVMFGGEDNGVFSDETWSWDGADWTLLTPTTSPSPRARGALSYDTFRQHSVWFGGIDALGVRTDTWIWDGTDWTEVVTPTIPGDGTNQGLFDHGLIYDEVRDRHILFGGTAVGTPQPDVFEFDGQDWFVRIAPNGPSARTGPAMAFIASEGRTYLFGGLGPPRQSDIWDYQTPFLALAEGFGPGCAGDTGTLSLTANTAPWLGSTFSAAADHLSLNGVAFHVLGFSNTSWNGTALPLGLNTLHSAGSGNCHLLTSPETNELVGPTLRGSSVVNVVIPNQPALAGADVYLQVVELVVESNAITAVRSTNGIRLTLGAR